MADCPNIDCQKRQDGHHTTLYGNGGMGGLVSCIQKKVSRTFLMWCAVIAISVGGTLAGLVYKAYSESQRQREEQFDTKFCTKEKYHEVNGKIIKMQTDLGYVKETTDELKQNSDKVLELLRKMERREKDPGSDYR